MTRPRGAARPVPPAGHLPVVGPGEIVAALRQRRGRREAAVAELREALAALGSRVERHLARVAELREAVEAQGGDVGRLRHYDAVMARLRAELRAAEQDLAGAFRTAAGS